MIADKRNQAGAEDLQAGAQRDDPVIFLAQGKQTSFSAQQLKDGPVQEKSQKGQNDAEKQKQP